MIIKAILAGMLLVLSFAPFHLPGLSFISLAYLFFLIQKRSARASFFIGFCFGLGFFGLGVSWLFVSIRNYGHLNGVIAASLTGLFITYLALYQGLMAYLYQYLKPRTVGLWAIILFSTLWCGNEILRATVFGGFPWLILGWGQIDSPLGQLLPLVGVLGVSWITCFLSGLLALAFMHTAKTRMIYLLIFVGALMTPSYLSHIAWSQPGSSVLSVGVIQANLSMRDKWDEQLFWKILNYYQDGVQHLLDQDIIVLPESAIPLPSHFVGDYLARLDEQARLTHTAILLGIPQSSTEDDSVFFNSLIGLGEAQGYYRKQHLVAFGEFIPAILMNLNQWLNLPTPNMLPGNTQQPLMTLRKHAFATLICYELAYPELLRQQLPEAEWIVSLSDDGWFGHSFAIYQHLQMAQVLSKQSARFQIVSNNDGLSSIINTSGEITASLPAFQDGLLRSFLQPSYGVTPWVQYGNRPLYVLMLLVFLSSIAKTIEAHRERRYPSRLDLIR
jgi:apolipoprotein N-acyltransferase